MKLDRINIQGFRSIESVTLDDCGGFNVVIGKNNAGKSNILLAINAFFACLQGGAPVLIAPPHARAFDHHAGNTDKPIQLTFDFQLTLAERDALIQDIITEAPRVKNAVEGIDPNLRLTITIIITPLPNSFAYVERMVLHKYDDQDTTDGASAYVILEISDAAARELADKAKLALLRVQEANYIDEMADSIMRIEPEAWSRAKIEFSDRRRLRYAFTGRSVPPSSEIQDRVSELIRKSDTAASFRETAQALSASLREEAEESRAEPLKNRIESFSGEEASIPIYALNLLERLAKMKVLYLTERREPIGKQEAEKILELKIERGGERTLSRIKETVSALLGVKIDAFRSKNSKSTSETPAELDVDDFLVQVNGAGIRESLRLILDYEFTRPDILLVEEPEIHLHPALETSMMRYLKRIGNECQIFITTHSTNFLDTAEMRNVYLASKNGSTKVQLIDVAEAEASIPQELGIRLSSLFMFDRLVFVEGPSDEHVLRELASTLGINLAQQSVGFVPMGGVRNLAHFAAERTLAFLTKRQVRMWFVLDRDERDEADVQQLTKTLSEKARLFVLEKREIENYLLSPRAVADFIEKKQKLANIKDQSPPTIAAVEQAISECADFLKEVAIERRVVKLACTPVYPNRVEVLNVDSGRSLSERITSELSAQKDKLNRVEGQLEEIIKEQRTAVDAHWDTKKTDFVPGDLLLDNVCRRFGVRFNKERDSSRLAALMTVDEIPSEIRRLIQEVGS